MSNSIASVLRRTLGDRRALIVVASPIEANAVAAGFGCDAGDALQEWSLFQLDDTFDLVRTGVGKAAAAGGTREAINPYRHRAVISLGIAGTLKPNTRDRIGTLVLADASVFADEGVRTPGGFEDLADRGFGVFPAVGNARASSVATDRRLLDTLTPAADAVGPIATVSTCAGTDALAHERAAMGCVAEAMEGAAVALVAQRLRVPFIEARVISNTTGDRPGQHWDIPAAIASLREWTTQLCRD